MADYLVENAFNSYLQSRNAKSKEILRAHTTNRFKVVFLKDIFDWPRTILQFSGINATEFYKWLKQDILDWKLFRDPILSRVDLYYRFQTPLSEDEDQFFFNTCEKIFHLNLQHQRNKGEQSLTISHQGSDRSSRIYTQKNQVYFKHKMKGRFINNYSNMFMSKCWEDFEDVISKHFLQYFGKHLSIDSVYLNWLVVKLRSIRPQPVPNLIFKMDYINSIDNIEDQKKVVQFLKFLIYTKDLNYVIQSIDLRPYRCVTFRLQDFLKFQDSTSEPISNYKLQKGKEFFEELKMGFLRSMFRDQKFQTLISIPKVEFWREGNQYWVVEIWIVDELLYYNYPFAFPDLFEPNISKTKFAVQFEIIGVFTASGLEKRFDIKQFIQTYPSSLSNQSIRQIKEFFIESVKV